MFKLNIVGTMFGSSGYDSHLRGLANALHELGHYVRLDVPKPFGWEIQCNDAELLMCSREFEEEMTMIFIGTPPYWRFGLADNPKEFYGFCVWEGDKVPEYWLEYLVSDKIDGILCPSEHVKDAIMKTLTNNSDIQVKDWDTKITDWSKIKVVPHGVDTNLFKPIEIDRPENFTFVCNKGWRGDDKDRGGVQYVLKAFCDEFSKDEPIELLLKLNPAYLPPGFNFDQALKNLGIDENHPQIRVNTQNMPFESLPSFYNMGDVFVCATRAEGFNIPGLEAKACGLPTIQTAFGGQTDYMQDFIDMKIGYKLEENTWDVMYEGIKWATPSITDLKLTMRKCFELINKKEVWTEIHDWTWKESAKKLIEAIK